MIDRVVSLVKNTPQTVRTYFQRRPDQFIDRLKEQIVLGIEATEALQDYMGKPNKKNAQRVRQLEREADEVRRILIDELNRTFVTPIDREDIYALSRALDDILDDTWFTINEMDILEVEPTDYLQEMAAELRQGAEEIKLAIERLEQHPGVASTHAIRARGVKGDLETLYAKGLAELFRKPKDLENVINMLKLREIYRHLFHAGGRIGDAADTIDDIVVKFF
jgi:predicted phosphate transport protein (TIGR00153 family)